MNKKTFTRVLIGLSVITAVATLITYFVMKPEKPWLAFYVACCGGVLVFNFLISLFLVNKRGDILKGKVRRVIVYKLDRISRSILDFATMMELF